MKLPEFTVGFMLLIPLNGPSLVYELADQPVSPSTPGCKLNTMGQAGSA